MNHLETLSAQGLIKAEVFQKLSLFVDLILRWNDRINLTGLKTRPQIEEILVGEAVFALDHLTISSRDVLDFGSGAGIPGLVWAICDPTARIVSLESRQKKIAFQKEVAREARLKAEIICGRFPEAAHGRSFDVIASRAIRFSPMLWDDALKMLRPGGWLVRFVTPNAEVEPSWRAVSISGRARLLTMEK